MQKEDVNIKRGLRYLWNWLYSTIRVYLFIAIAQDEKKVQVGKDQEKAQSESIFLDVLHFPMKNIKSCDLEATPMGGSTSKPTSDVVCWRDVGRVSP